MPNQKRNTRAAGHAGADELTAEQQAAMKWVGALRAAGLDPDGQASSVGAMLVPTLAAAGLIGIKQQTLALWRSERQHALPYVKVGRRVHYRYGDLRRFIDAQTRRPAAA